jgi:uroporphyrinogen decarboxylase
VDFALDRDRLAALFDAVLEVSLAICERQLDEVGGGADGDEVDAILTAGDLGVQQSLMISPDAFRALVKPRLARYFDLIHAKSPAKVLFHTCGSVCVLGAVHNLQPDVPVENILAMVGHARGYTPSYRR